MVQFSMRIFLSWSNSARISITIFWAKTFPTQSLPGPNFFKPSIPAGLCVFQAFTSLFFLFLFICLLFFNMGFQMYPRLNEKLQKSYWLHLLDLPPQCIFKCLKPIAWVDAKSHWLHLFDFSPVCVFKCVLRLPAQEDAKSHRLHLFGFSPLCIFKWTLKWSTRDDAKFSLVAFVLLFSSMYFQMNPQMVWPKRCKITLVVFLWFFSTVFFEMSPQTAYRRWCILALVALVWLFSIVWLSDWNITIDHAFTWFMLSKILIHHQQITYVVSHVILASNWEKYYWLYMRRTKVKVRHVTIDANSKWWWLIDCWIGSWVWIMWIGEHWYAFDFKFLGPLGPDQPLAGWAYVDH